MSKPTIDEYIAKLKEWNEARIRDTNAIIARESHSDIRTHTALISGAQDDIGFLFRMVTALAEEMRDRGLLPDTPPQGKDSN